MGALLLSKRILRAKKRKFCNSGYKSSARATKVLKYLPLIESRKAESKAKAKATWISYNSAKWHSKMATMARRRSWIPYLAHARVSVPRPFLFPFPFPCLSANYFSCCYRGRARALTLEPTLFFSSLLYSPGFYIWNLEIYYFRRAWQSSVGLSQLAIYRCDGGGGGGDAKAWVLSANFVVAIGSVSEFVSSSPPPPIFRSTICLFSELQSLIAINSRRCRHRHCSTTYSFVLFVFGAYATESGQVESGSLCSPPCRQTPWKLYSTWQLSLPLSQPTKLAS